MENIRNKTNVGVVLFQYAVITGLWIVLATSCQTNQVFSDPPEIAVNPDEVYVAKEGFVLVPFLDTVKLAPISYIQAGDRIIYQGDIMIRPFIWDTSDHKKVAEMLMNISVFGRTWPDKTIYYTIGPKLEPRRGEVLEAMDVWKHKAGFRFVEIKAFPFPDNCVHFVDGIYGCSSTSIGMAWGNQYVSISSGSSVGNIKHEIGHVIGLEHEHCRNDRNLHIKVTAENILQGWENQFNVMNGQANGTYDYGSIMHYGRKGLARPGKITITPIPDSTVAIGQRETLSYRDSVAVAKMYPTPLATKVP